LPSIVSFLTAGAKVERRNVITLRTVVGREPPAKHRAAQPPNVLSRDRVDSSAAERRRDLHAVHRLAVLQVRQPAGHNAQSAIRAVLGAAHDVFAGCGASATTASRP
jgi:hypothetical protein